MTTLLRTLIITSLVAGLLMACADHQLRPTAPLRLRLKTIFYSNANDSLARQDYTYDANNRLATITTPSGSKIVYEYDEQNRYKKYSTSNPAYPMNDEVTQFVYNYSNYTNDFQVFIGARQQGDYTVDANKRILKFTSFQVGFYQNETYSYTGDNVTTIEYRLGSSTSKTNFEYDTHPSPFYGLAGPGFTAEQSLSRNNVTKLTYPASGDTVEIQYEYNAQGLPIKQKIGTIPTSERVYTYESY